MTDTYDEVQKAIKDLDNTSKRIYVQKMLENRGKKFVLEDKELWNFYVQSLMSDAGLFSTPHGYNVEAINGRVLASWDEDAQVGTIYERRENDRLFRALLGEKEIFIEEEDLQEWIKDYNEWLEQ